MAIYCVFDYRQCIGMNDIKYFYCKTNYPETNFNSFTHLLLNGTPVHLGPGERSRYSDSLRARRSGDRIPVGARFLAPDQTGPEAYSASCTMDTGSFPGVKRPGRGFDHPPPCSAKVEERVQLYLYSPSGPSWPVLG
jgi:hypothetical protein